MRHGAALAALRRRPALRNADSEARQSIQNALRHEWIRIGAAKESAFCAFFQLPRGEAEAIALAMNLNAGRVLIDEQEGRQTGSKAGLMVTGVLGILLRAKRVGEISAVKPEVDLLSSKAHFFISSDLEPAILRAAGE